jgi:predicted metal-dependent hydrolase
MVDNNIPYHQKMTVLEKMHPKAIEGIVLFNAGQYWKAHEALEEAWMDETGEVRHLYRGILQVGVTYLHVERKTTMGH